MIIFSYLGAEIPEYAYLNAVNTQIRFPSLDVGMIVSNQNNARRIEKLGIHPFVYRTEVNDSLFSQMTADRRNFRSGFWRYTLERLFSLESSFSQGENSIVHVESDVVLLNGFEKMNYQGMRTSWLKHKQNEDSAAVFHIGSKNDFEEFNDHLKRHLRQNPNLSEMQILSRLRAEESSKFGFLPSISSDGEISRDGHNLNNNIAFDPAVLGMWLFGSDPRNHFGFTKKFILNGEKNTEAFDINFELDVEKPNVYLGLEANVVSLHVHTKDKKVFQDPYEAIRIQLNSKRKVPEFSPSIFIEVYQEFAKRRKKTAFFLSLLGLYKPINFIRKTISDFGR